MDREALIAKYADDPAVDAGGIVHVDERLSGYEDDDLFLRMFRAGWRNAYVDEPLMRYRRHTANSVFSERMWRSREIYASKRVEAFPDDPDLARFFVRDIIAPRFFRTEVDDHKRHLACGRWDLCQGARGRTAPLRRVQAAHAPPACVRADGVSGVLRTGLPAASPRYAVSVMRQGLPRHRSIVPAKGKDAIA